MNGNLLKFNDCSAFMEENYAKLYKSDADL